MFSHLHQMNDMQPSSHVKITSVQFSHSVVSDSLPPHEPQHKRPPCASPTPGGHPNPCPLSRWCHPTISSSVAPSSSCPHSFPASGSFQMSQFFASGNQSIGVSASASVLPMTIQDWFPIWRRKWQPTPVLLPGKSRGWRSLVGYSPWGRKESDTTEWLNFLFL